MRELVVAGSVARERAARGERWPVARTAMLVTAVSITLWMGIVGLVVSLL